MKTLLLVAALPPLLLGCSRSLGAPSTAASTTEAAALPAPALVGQWRGVITGREMATAAGLSAMAVWLTVNPDGTFTMSSPNGVAEGRVIPRGPRRIELDGRYVRGAEAPTGAPVHATLAAQRGGLGGRTLAYFSGHTIDTGIDLKKVQ
jgi:hypothetical protein